MTDEVLATRNGAAGILSLNRPRAIHALTLDMVHAMTNSLLEWRGDDGVAVVMIDHQLPADGDPKLSRGFCAGGDIAFLRNSALNDGGASGRKFFHDEYQLNHLLMTYGKPVVAFMDGITMGGGVGIAGPATYRVATENTKLAMPETGIGLFPDVGGGWFLSRLKGRLGQYLALTGARLDGAECLWAGLATHYLPSANLAQAKARIAAEPDNIPAILRELSAVPPEPKIAAHAADIARLFASDRYEDILDALEADSSDFAAETLKTLHTKSPQTCKVALRQLATSLTLPDFAEGVRAVIVDKDHAPKWSPATAERVTDDLLDQIFAPLGAADEWKPL